MTIPNLTESVNEMLKFARCCPGCVQRHNTKNGLRVDLMVEDGYVFFNMSRIDDYPTRDEYLLAVCDILDITDLASVRVMEGDRRCIICVWQDDYD